MISSSVPLCVDLDGTLVKTDTLWEAIIRLLRRKPSLVGRLLWWLAQGKAFFKAEVARAAKLDVRGLPYRPEVLSYIQQAKREGRPVALATASDQSVARAVVSHLGLFDDVIASSGQQNLSGGAKARALVQRFGEKGFDYIGDRYVDLPVWVAARRAVVVRATPWLVHAVQARQPQVEVLTWREPLIAALLRAMRPHQWIKNILVLVPLVMAHRLMEAPLLGAGLRAFVALSLVASALYIFNDLLDMEADRQHPRKRRRPLAAGDLPIPLALATAALLFLAGIGIAVSLSTDFLAVLFVYVVGSASYSLWIKRVIVVDVVLLSVLYMLRLVAGSTATQVPISKWLLLFSLFFFSSLALLKRYIELAGRGQAKRRGYRVSHQVMVWQAGLGAGIASVVVLALYVFRSRQVVLLYAQLWPWWIVCALFLFWVVRAWQLARRSALPDDPVLFAVRDKVTWGLGALAAVLLYVAAL